MKNNINLNTIYKTLNTRLNLIDTLNSEIEESIIDIIKELSLSEEFKIFDKNNYNFEEIFKLLRFYESELRLNFEKGKNDFDLTFKCYILLIKSFTKLCSYFATNIEKRFLINEIFQALKESKNILKFTVSLEEKYINTLNNIIGEELYYFSHIQYIHTKDKSLDYIFEEYFLNLEKMYHGFELSESTNFDNKDTSQEEEYSIFINNASFLLLKMVHKLNYYRANSEYFDNIHFQKVSELFCEISTLSTSFDLKNMEEFKELILKEFVKSASYLLNKNKCNMFEDKIRLLALNTDEYKQLIDIISTYKDK